MSIFSHCLAEVLKNRFDGNQSTLSRMSGVSQTLISRYLKGEHRPDVQVVDAICKILPPQDNARLACAYLGDTCPPSAIYLIRLEPIQDQSERMAEQTVPVLFKQLDSTTRGAIEFLVSEAIRNPTARDHLINTASLLDSNYQNRIKDLRARNVRTSKTKGQLSSKEFSAVTQAAEKSYQRTLRHSSKASPRSPSTGGTTEKKS